MRRRRDSDVASLYVDDSYNHLIRQIVISTRVVTTLAGTGSSGSTDNTTAHQQVLIHLQESQLMAPTFMWLIRTVTRFVR